MSQCTEIHLKANFLKTFIKCIVPMFSLYSRLYVKIVVKGGRALERLRAALLGPRGACSVPTTCEGPGSLSAEGGGKPM